MILVLIFDYSCTFSQNIAKSNEKKLMMREETYKVVVGIFDGSEREYPYKRYGCSDRG